MRSGKRAASCSLRFHALEPRRLEDSNIRLILCHQCTKALQHAALGARQALGDARKPAQRTRHEVSVACLAVQIRPIDNGMA